MGKRQRQPGKLIRQDPYEEKVDLYRWLLIVYFIIYFSMLFVAIICNIPSPFDVNGLNHAGWIYSHLKGDPYLNEIATDE